MVLDGLIGTIRRLFRSLTRGGRQDPFDELYQELYEETSKVVEGAVGGELEAREE